jgi:hypothetical protein
MRNTVREGDGEMIPVLVAGADIWLKLTGLCQVAESASLIDYPGFLPTGANWDVEWQREKESNP